MVTNVRLALALHHSKNTFTNAGNCGSAGSTFFLLTGLSFVRFWQREAPGWRPCQKLGRTTAARWPVRLRWARTPDSVSQPLEGQQGRWPAGHIRLFGVISGVRNRTVSHFNAWLWRCKHSSRNNWMKLFHFPDLKFMSGLTEWRQVLTRLLCNFWQKSAG